LRSLGDLGETVPPSPRSPAQPASDWHNAITINACEWAPVHRSATLDSSRPRWHGRPNPQRIDLAVKTFFLRFFTWWNGQTFGTQFWTWLYGEFVGQDEFGNRYFRTRGGKIDRTLLMERRWVIYAGEAEPSTVPPAWHGWLHHTVDVPPTDERYQPRAWQKPHRPNLTGTPAAHRPSGSTLAQGRRPKATGDYKPWRPGINSP
jgi:NADH:ubiquinone oxidoreductase subunit